MNLGKKKALAARTFKVGKKRITFVVERAEEIKEAITKQDIKDLHKEGAIILKNVKGATKNKQKRKKRSPGNIRKKVNTRKQDYVIMTRKLRKYLIEMKKQGKLSQEQVIDMRKKIRNKAYKSLNHLKEYIGGLEK